MFASAADRTAADASGDTPQYWRNAIALGDAKAWRASLDKLRGAESPSAQITDYLYRTKVRWGILTNGARWRLYEREASAPGGVWFEVDLLGIIERQDLEAFRWFYLFFRRGSFIAAPGQRSAVDEVLEESKRYATDVGNSLKESVYDALRYLMNGFFAETANKLDPADPAQLKQVHESSLIVLYRLLFLLFAEDKRVGDRHLLPVEHETYKTYSLAALHQEVNAKLRAREPRGPGSFARIGKQLWPRICSLFEIIDQGLAECGIPAYNGGLFSPQQHPQIAYKAHNGARRWEIGDAFIAEVIDRLAYKREAWDTPGRDDIDYATLDVRHLGSIYEGLLELRPALAAADLVEAADAKKITFVAAAGLKAEPKRIKGAPPRRIAAGEVYLLTDRGERKATGSYYTPSYIVNYIVEQTVGPLAAQAARQAAGLFDAVDREAKGLRAAIDKLTPAGAMQRPKLERELRDCRLRLLAPYLSLKVLDPAMGSGHFLVGAADFLSQQMANDETLTLLYEPPAGEDPQEHFKRLVVEHCLYGVDLNPLAVELAKLSLWLHTVSRDKALSFLDHHLRCGNSLIGARIEDDLTTAPPSPDAKQRKRLAAKGGGQQMVLGFSQALEGKDLAGFLDSFRQIVERPTDSAQDEHAKEEIYAAMDAQREKYRGVANLWLAPYFGVAVSDMQYGQAVEALNAGGPAWAALCAEEWYIAAQQAAQAKRFFHWELEFPEAFFTLTPARDATGGRPTQTAKFKPKDQRGFDAVIGNPPYGAKVTEDEKRVLAEKFKSAGSSVDSFALMIENGLKLIRERAECGYIVPSGWLTSPEHEPLRRYVIANSSPQYIIHLPYDVFPDAYIDCILFIALRGLRSKPNTCSILRIGIREDPQNAILNPHYADINADSWIADGKSRMITQAGSGLWLSSWRKNPGYVLLTELVEVTRGITPYLRRDSDTTRISVKGYWGSIGRYAFEDDDYYDTIYDEDLSEYRDRKYFSGERLIVRRIISRQFRIHIAHAVDDFVINKSYLIAVPKQIETRLFFIAATLNSRIISHSLVQMSESAKKDDFPQLDIVTLNEIPIPRISFTTPQPERERLVAQAKAQYTKYLESGNTAGVLALFDGADGPALDLSSSASASAGADDGKASAPGKAKKKSASTEACSTDDGGRGVPPHRDEDGAHGGPPNQDKDGERGGSPHSDVMHDLLAFLAEEMTRLHKERLAEARGFLNWLGGYLGLAVDQMTGKTKLKAYYDPAVCGGFAGFFAELVKNKRRFSAPDGKPRDPEGREARAELEREYNASVKKLAPLLRTIELTDRLIDQLVYKLYGLTDEEIAVVEGKA